MRCFNVSLRAFKKKSHSITNIHGEIALLDTQQQTRPPAPLGPAIRVTSDTPRNKFSNKLCCKETWGWNRVSSWLQPAARPLFTKQGTTPHETSGFNLSIIMYLFFPSSFSVGNLFFPSNSPSLQEGSLPTLGHGGPAERRVLNLHSQAVTGTLKMSRVKKRTF